MLESVRCPSCSSRYGLRLQRVKSGIRRARCFRCRSIFGIEAEVLRLLATAAAEPEVILEPEALPALQPMVAVESESTLESDEDPQIEMANLDFPAHPEAALESEAAMELEEASLGEMTAHDDPTLSQVSPEDLPPSLTLGDLEGAEEEILEKTLVLNPSSVEEASAAQEVRATLPDPGGSYASAKDAISRLLGEAPRVDPQAERRQTHTGNTMDVEAALDALDSTLGGSPIPRDLGTKPVQQPSQFRIPIPEPPSAKPMNSTIKLSHEELMAAMASAAMPTSAAPQPTAPPKPAAQPALPAHSPMAINAESQDQNLYKVQLPKETQNNVSLEVLTTWIEQGRVQEFHMVARQQSEHWIEAGKVPALRMVFERLKRSQPPMVQQAQATLLPPPNEAVPVKKGIFGGLFGRS